MRAAQRRQISLVFGWSSMFGSSAFASAGTEQGISYAARRLKPLRWWGIGLAFGGSDVSAASAQVDDQPRQGRTGGSFRQAASHPRIGGTGVPTPGLSEQASN